MTWHHLAWTRDGALRKRKTALLAVSAAASVMLILANSASASSIEGQTTVSPTSGSQGDTISVGGSGARPSTTYQIRFLNFVSEQNSMNSCLAAAFATHPDIHLGAAETSNSAGGFTTVSRTIPTDVHPSNLLINHGAHSSSSTSTPQGPASVCHQTSDGNYATNDALITIL